MSTEDTAQADRPLSSTLHRWAVAIVCLVWPLIWVGGLVTTYDAGMAVPDWPGTYGKNLFLYPYQTWLLGPFDLFIEHGHRLLGAIVGFLAIIAVVIAWFTEPRRWVRWFSVGLLVAVIGQGVLGGMRVVLSDRTLAMVHGCTGPLFFVICVLLAVVTSRWWLGQTGAKPSFAAPAKGQTWFLAGIVVISYGQLLLGAQLRHVQASASPGAFTHLVVMHIAGAFLLWTLTAVLAAKVWRSNPQGQLGSSDEATAHHPMGGDPKTTGNPKSHGRRSQKTGCGDLTLSRPCYLLVGFVALQIALGLGTWVANYGWPYFAQVGPASAGYLVKSKAFTESIVTTAHVATGSLILALSAAAWLRTMRAKYRFASNDSGDAKQQVVDRAFGIKQRLEVS